MIRLYDLHDEAYYVVRRADGSVHEYPFGLAQIEFMGEITANSVRS